MKRFIILVTLAVAVLGTVLGCSSGSSSPNPNATGTSAYFGGYTFGNTAGQDDNSPEADLMNNYAGPNPCTEIQYFGVGNNSGVPSGEIPPAGDNAAGQQWANGCYAGWDAATGEQIPTNG